MKKIILTVLAFSSASAFADPPKGVQCLERNFETLYASLSLNQQSNKSYALTFTSKVATGNTYKLTSDQLGTMFYCKFDEKDAKIFHCYQVDNKNQPTGSYSIRSMLAIDVAGSSVYTVQTRNSTEGISITEVSRDFYADNCFTNP